MERQKDDGRNDGDVRQDSIKDIDDKSRYFQISVRSNVKPGSSGSAGLPKAVANIAAFDWAIDEALPLGRIYQKSELRAICDIFVEFELDFIHRVAGRPQHDDDLFPGREFDTKFGIVAAKPVKLLGAESDRFDIKHVFSFPDVFNVSGTFAITATSCAITLPPRSV